MMGDETDQRVKRPHGLETQRMILEAAGRIFARTSYAEARLKDIAEEGQISQGSLYFHFGNKEDLARAVLDAQTERMTELVQAAVEGEGSGLERLLRHFADISHRIATDPLVQGGMMLALQPGTSLELKTRAPYLEWREFARAMIRDGIEDGSVNPAVDADLTADALTDLFLGAEVFSRIEDGWASLPAHAERNAVVARYLLTAGK